MMVGLKNSSGAAAVEFALVCPAFAALLFGILNASVLLFDIASLNYATERAARCASVNSTLCGDATAIQTYAADNYFATGAPVFSYSASACGKLVEASLSFDLNAIVYTAQIPLAAQSCFP